MASAVLSVPTTAPSGTGLAGIETRFMTRSLQRPDRLIAALGSRSMNASKEHVNSPLRLSDKRYFLLKNKVLRPLAEGVGRSHMGVVQASRLHDNSGLARWADRSACRSTKEDMPCELSILLPSIVRPLASTGCSPSSIR